MLWKKHTKAKKPHNATWVLAYCCGWVKLLFSHTVLSVTDFRASVKTFTTSFSSCQQQCKLKLFCSLVPLSSNPAGLFHEYILLLSILIQSNNGKGKKKRRKNILQHVAHAIAVEQHPISSGRFMIVWLDGDWMWNWGGFEHCSVPLITGWHLWMKGLVFQAVKAFRYWSLFMTRARQEPVRIN